MNLGCVILGGESRSFGSILGPRLHVAVSMNWRPFLWMSYKKALLFEVCFRAIWFLKAPM